MEHLRTAQYTAACRQVESQRAEGDRLFSDPHAAAFAGQYGADFLRAMAEAASSTPERLASSAAVRTRFFDELVQRAAREQGVRQVVVLAVGGDARSRRLDLPAGTAFFEVDLPVTMDHRRAVMGPPPAGLPHRVVEVAADLSRPDRWPALLRQAGYDPAAPSVWLAEGLLMYLRREEAESLLETVAGLSAPGSVLGLDLMSSAFVGGEAVKDFMAAWGRWGALPLFGVDEPEGWLAQHARLRQVQVKEMGEEGCDFGRVDESSKEVFLRRFPRKEHPSALPRNLMCVGVRA